MEEAHPPSPSARTLAKIKDRGTAERVGRRLRRRERITAHLSDRVGGLELGPLDHVRDGFVEGHLTRREPDVDDDAGRAPQQVFQAQQPRVRLVEIAELGHELFDVQAPALDHQIASDRAARERVVVRGHRELQVMAGIPLVARDHRDAGGRMALETLARRALVVVVVRQRHPEPSAPR